MGAAHPQAPPHQGALQVEGLSILAQQHDVLLQVVEAAVLVVADAFLRVVAEAALAWDPALRLGIPVLGVLCLIRPQLSLRGTQHRLGSPGGG